jgi:hypothetical protein
MICLVSSCTHKADSIILSKTANVAIDESSLVLLRLPQKLRPVTDSAIAVINSAQKLSLYNIYSGKNQSNFSLEKFNFDSLVEETYKKKYSGIKEINYEKEYQLNGTNYQLINYYNTKNSFYVLVSLLAEVKLLDAAASSLINGLENKAIQAEDVEIQVMDYLNFVFVTDNNFKIREVIPMYAESFIRNDQYYPYYHKNFLVQENIIYIPVAKIDPNPNLEAKISAIPGTFSLVKVDLHNQNSLQYLMDNKNLDFSDFRLQDYLATHFSYCITGDHKELFCSAKEIAELSEHESKIFEKKHLQSNEWIESFSETKNGKFTILSSTVDKKNSVVISGRTCPVDTITAKTLRTFDLSEGKWNAEAKLPLIRSEMCLSQNKILFLSKDENNYYINYIEFNEK